MDLALQAQRVVPSLSRDKTVVYLLEPRSGRYYVGCSTDYETRLKDHVKGIACRTTRMDPPVRLLWIELQPDFPTARLREAQIKKWSRAKKLALVRGDLELLRRLSQSCVFRLLGNDICRS